MIIWTLFTLLIVVGVKYYTSLEMRKLERRLETVKNGLHQVKDQLQSVQDRQRSVQSEETLFEDRLKVMKEIIQDIQFRMTSSDEYETERIISDSLPPPSF